MSFVDHQPTSPLQQLAVALLAISPSNRGATMQAVISFRAEPAWKKSLDVGWLRALFAEVWELRFSVAVPIRAPAPSCRTVCRMDWKSDFAAKFRYNFFMTVTYLPMADAIDALVDFGDEIAAYLKEQGSIEELESLPQVTSFLVGQLTALHPGDPQALSDEQALGTLLEFGNHYTDATIAQHDTPEGHLASCGK